MLKKEIKFIVDFNVNKLKNYSGLLTLNDIKKSGIHPAILKYILAKIEYQLFLDTQKLKKNSPFEYNDERVTNYLNLINENIKRKNKFKFDYLSDLVQDAVVFNVHFLIAPNKTLTDFIFNKANTKTVKEIAHLLSHIYYYKYFRKIILTYLEKKNIEIISKSEFIKLLKKIDGISLKTHLNDTINTAVNSIANLFEEASSKDSVPVKAVELYLKGKRLTTHAKAMQTEYLNNEIFHAPVTEIKNLLSAVSEDEIIVENNEEDENNFEEEKIIEEQNDNNPDVLEIEEQDEQIPNEEILSDNKNISDAQEQAEDKTPTPNDISTPEEVEVKENENNVIFKEENLIKNLANEAAVNIADENQITSEETVQLKENTTEENIQEQNEQVENTEDVLPEKPDVKTALTELIDTEKLFDELLEEKEIEPESMPLTNTQDFLNTLDDNVLEFQMDKPEDTLQKEAVQDDADKLEEQFQSVYEADLPDEEAKETGTTNDAENVLSEEKDEKTEEVIKEVNDYIEKEKNNKIINEEKITGTEPENIAKETTENLNLNSQNLNEKAIADENIVQKDITLTEDNNEEITEVFADLTFLGKEETEENILEEVSHDETAEEKNTEEHVEESKTKEIVPDDELLNDYNEEEILTQTETLTDTKKIVAYSSFKEMIVQEDMSAIIETIFDYDMEDFQNTIQKISETEEVTDALKILNDYCKQNYVLSTSAELEKFEKLIIDYFKHRQA